jgi:hypothetical protein
MFVTIFTYSLSLYENFDILLEEADYIFIGKVLSGKIGEDIPAEYEIKIIEPLKGCEKDEIIINHGHYGLELGMEYLFLLKNNGKNIFMDFFEGVNKFKIIYEHYKNELEYCVKIPLTIIGMNEELIGDLYNPKNNLWNYTLYKIEDVKRYIQKKLYSDIIDISIINTKYNWPYIRNYNINSLRENNGVRWHCT